MTWLFLSSTLTWSSSHRRMIRWTAHVLCTISFIVENLTCLFFQILSSFVKVDVAMAFLDFISLVELPSLVSVAHIYLKALTSSSFCPFMKICASDVLELSFITLFFLLLTSIPGSLGQFSSKLLKFSIASSHQVDVVCKPMVAQGSCSNWNGRFRIVNSFAHHFI